MRAVGRSAGSAVRVIEEGGEVLRISLRFRPVGTEPGAPGQRKRLCPDAVAIVQHGVAPLEIVFRRIEASEIRTVVVVDAKQAVVAVPPLSGARIERHLRLAEGDSLPHWGKSLGWDAGKNMHYLVADSDLDHVAGAILHNKSNTGLLHMLQTSNVDNQTYDVKVIRNQYAHGDTYIYYCDFNYMSNIHSAAGDENGNCYGAFIRSKDNNFHGVVEALDNAAGRLTFRPGARNVDTLGNSRPLVNRNPDKAITSGKVSIVPAECYWEPVDKGRATCKLDGKAYPTRLIKNPRTGVNELSMGGLIRGDKDCPWTADIVGRYFAVNEPSERTPKGSLRWYQVRSFEQNDDGSKEIGRLHFVGGGISTGGPVTDVAGLSADKEPARNLRGKNVPVAPVAKSIRIRFPRPESVGDYAVFLEQSWLTNRAVGNKGPEGFTVTFSDPAPEEATLDWMIVR